ncbi:uncharacterized protein BDR25DRAFT_348449 [Lindgomyces ingoldianus]|uniref:Uncharacterized protein n=1 Tax=Lindgomyces ingoldianus TaxID=673940 RepID=A0ACB6RFU7_9PLEO|nr:uncharacterized protein BDR25DRAFT_348449 [Lindgomyces ingoldianus]KAF2478188.1 hypothetical protein BDR25DRAFT_348449 [Lindgomyces ingoldianus]
MTKSLSYAFPKQSDKGIPHRKRTRLTLRVRKWTSSMMRHCAISQLSDWVKIKIRTYSTPRISGRILVLQVHHHSILLVIIFQVLGLSTYIVNLSRILILLFTSSPPYPLSKEYHGVGSLVALFSPLFGKQRLFGSSRSLLLLLEAPIREISSLLYDIKKSRFSQTHRVEIREIKPHSFKSVGFRRSIFTLVVSIIFKTLAPTYAAVLLRFRNCLFHKSRIPRSRKGHIYPLELTYTCSLGASHLKPALFETLNGKSCLEGHLLFSEEYTLASSLWKMSNIISTSRMKFCSLPNDVDKVLCLETTQFSPVYKLSKTKFAFEVLEKLEKLYTGNPTILVLLDSNFGKKRSQEIEGSDEDLIPDRAGEHCMMKSWVVESGHNSWLGSKVEGGSIPPVAGPKCSSEPKQAFYTADYRKQMHAHTPASKQPLSRKRINTEPLYLTCYELKYPPHQLPRNPLTPVSNTPSPFRPFIPSLLPLAPGTAETPPTLQPPFQAQFDQYRYLLSTRENR